MLRAIVWMLRAIVWMLRAIVWMLRAIVICCPKSHLLRSAKQDCRGAHWQSCTAIASQSGDLPATGGGFTCHRGRFTCHRG
eukprot:5242-Prorocentrum_minimum.AAC.1